LHNATHAVENGERLIQQLLAFVRKEELSPKAVDLNQLLGGMLQLLQTSIGGTIRVEMRKQPGLWPVLVDPNQFELVLLNLAINARDAMPEGGTLTIEARNSNFGASDRPRDLSAGDCAVLSIRDTGTGMSEAVRLRAFDPFFTTKGPGKGSGLGLSMALRVAKQSGGTVRIDSRPGEGTMIEVYLPRAEMAAASKDLQGNGHAQPGLAAAGAMTPEVVGLGKPGIVEPMQRARDVFPSRPAARRIGEPDVSRAAKSTD
jgi:signal transduction histidine kinase